MVNQRAIGAIIFVFAVIIAFHWFYSHFIKDMLAIELIVSFVGLFTLSAIILIKFIVITKKTQAKYGYAIIGLTVLTTIHWVYVHFLNGQLVPELILSFVGLYIIGGLVAYKIIEVTRK